VCCATSTGVQFPKPLSLPKPPFPPVARAVRARGKVLVRAAIDKDGNVTSATALNGHPLLRAASMAAARASKFEPANTETKREVRLTYIFQTDDEKVDTTLRRYTNPYQITIISIPLHIDY
jgi:TonB family protein